MFLVGSELCLETAAQDPHQVLLALSAANTRSTKIIGAHQEMSGDGQIVRMTGNPSK